MGKKSLVLIFLTLLLFSSASSAPAFEVLDGELRLNENPIENASYISVNQAITDGNISENLTVGSSGTVNISALGQDGASSGEILEWNGSQWTPATDDGGANQSLSATNDSTGTDDLVSLDGGGGSLLIDDDFEADTLNANQTVSATNDSTGTDDLVSLDGNGGSVLIKDNYATDDQSLTLTNDSVGKDDRIKIDNGNTVLIDDSFEADSVKDNQNLSANNASNPSNLPKGTNQIYIDGGENVAIPDFYEADTNVSTQCSVTNELLDAEGDCVSIGTGLTSGTTLEIDSVGNANIEYSAINNSQIQNGAVNGSQIGVSANNGEVLEYDGSDWTSAKDDINANQTLYVSNDSAGNNEAITLTGNGTVYIEDDFEADTLNANQTVSATNDSTGTDDLISLGGNGGSVLLNDDYAADDQTLTLTNDSSGTAEKISIGNGNTILLNDDFEADTDTVKDNQNLSITNDTTPSVNKVGHDVSIDGGDGMTVRDYYDPDTVNANQTVSATNDSTGTDDSVSLGGNGGSVLINDNYAADDQSLSLTNDSKGTDEKLTINSGNTILLNDDFDPDTVKDNQNLTSSNASKPSGLSSVSHSLQIDGGNNAAFPDFYEEDTLNANQTVSATNDSTGTDDLISLGGNGGSVLLSDDYSADDQTLTLTNDSTGTDDRISIGNGNTVLVNDDFASDTSASTQCSNGKYLAGNGTCANDLFEADNLNANQTVSATNDSTGKDDLISLGGNGGSVLVNDDFETDTVKDNQNLTVNNATDPSSSSSVSHDIKIDGGDNIAVKDYYESNSDASTKCSGGKYLAGNGTCANDVDTDINTQLDDEQPTSNVNMGANNVTNADSVSVNDVTNKAGGNSCTASQEGQIVYNGTVHLGCDGTNWNALY